ncbi:MAG: glycosyltransferase [Planctomycetes bacterium]|nr:glycosyltransferase [Planctomycetota bacterium]
MTSVSVVIPSADGWRGGNVPRLVEAARSALGPDAEVVVVQGVRPCAAAHNEGARRAQGELLLFLDDDVIPEGPATLRLLVETLVDPTIGIAGAAQVPPPPRNAFQRWWTHASDRAAFRPVESVTDSDMATHAAMAIRRSVYREVGGEPAACWRADDQVLRARVREAGYRVVVVPGCLVFHPAPPGWSGYLRRRVRDGIAAAHDARVAPEAIVDLSPDGGARWGTRRTRARRARDWFVRSARAFGAGDMAFLVSRAAYAFGYGAGALFPGRFRNPL